MLENLSKGRVTLFIVAIMLTNIVVMADLAIYVIANDLYLAFPDSVNVVNFILSGPALILAGASLLTPVLLKFVSKKNLLVLMGLVFAVVSILGAAYDNVYYVASMRGIAGFTMGIVNVVAIAILTDAFIDEGKRAKIIGLYNTIMPITGSVIAAIAGVLALQGWQNVFNVYWLAVPMVLMLIIFVPKTARQKDGATLDQATHIKSKEPMGVNFWILTGCFALLILGIMALHFFISVYIAEHNLGDVAFVGLANTIVGYGSVLANAVFGFVFVKLRRKVLLLAYICPIIGCLLLMFVPNSIVVMVAYFIALAGFGFGFSAAYAYFPTLVPVAKIESAIAIATSTYAIATFFGTYFVTITMGLMNADTFTAVIPVILAIFVIIFVAELVMPKKFKGAEY